MRPITLGLLALLLISATAVVQSHTGPNTAAAAALRRAQAFIASSACPSAEARAAVPEPMTFMGREVTYHRILIEGCGRRIQRNYVASFDLSDGSWHSSDVLHGTSILLGTTGTDWRLGSAALGAADRAVRTAAPTCDEIMPQSLDFEGSDSEPAAPRRTRPWTETWVFGACGPTFAVEMQFTPNGSDGTDFSVSAVRQLD